MLSKTEFQCQECRLGFRFSLKTNLIPSALILTLLKKNKYFGLYLMRILEEARVYEQYSWNADSPSSQFNRALLSSCSLVKYLACGQKASPSVPFVDSSVQREQVLFSLPPPPRDFSPRLSRQFCDKWVPHLGHTPIASSSQEGVSECMCFSVWGPGAEQNKRLPLQPSSCWY